MLDLSAFASTTSSRAVALLRLTMSATTPGCGIIAMSGVSPAWILVMMIWLMLSTLDHLTVTPAACAAGAIPACRPAMMGASTLVQIVTVDPLTWPEGLPLSDDELEPELRHADVSSVATLTAANALMRVGPRMNAPSSSEGSGAGASKWPARNERGAASEIAVRNAASGCASARQGRVELSRTTRGGPRLGPPR